MVVTMTKPRYPRKQIKTWSNLFFTAALIFLGLSVLYTLYQIRNIKLQVDVPTEIVSVQPTKVYDNALEVKAIDPPYKPGLKDPCFDIKLQKDAMESADKKLITSYRNKLDMFMADLAFEIEIAKQGHIPVARVKDLLKKHDNTQRQIYNKVYKP
jgi:hypothetical protein